MRLTLWLCCLVIIITGMKASSLQINSGKGKEIVASCKDLNKNKPVRCNDLAFCLQEDRFLQKKITK